jgi:RNA polymerase sigma-70 factor (ECF subfamily)
MPATFETHRPRLRALAYRMLGTRGDAEDMVQEAWLRWQAVDRAQVDNVLAYLCRTTTHLCLDHLQSARARREQYVGLWLPEPLVDGALADYQDKGPEAALGLRQHLSLGFLLALQYLSPLERAAFLLHDVFDRDFDEVAQTLGRSVAACRQLASRARKRLQTRGFGPDLPPPTPPDDARTLALLGAFAQALAEGDVQALAELLAEDVHLYSDGGGVVCAVPVPLGGRLRVAQALLTFARTWQRNPGAQALRPASVNGQPGALAWNAEGQLEDVCALELDASGRVRGVYFQRNPAKLVGVVLA